MKQHVGSGARHVLAAAIAAALAGTAVAADPSLRVLSDGAVQVIPLAEVSYRPGDKRLVARSIAGNVDCGTVQAPGAGTLQLELDGKRYTVRTSALPGGLAAPMSYAPGATRQVSLSLTEIVAATACKSSGVTMYDYVMVGPGGQVTAHSRVAQAVEVLLPQSASAYPAVVLTLADPIHCESYGAADPGLVQELTYPNGAIQAQFGLDRLEYRLAADGNGRRELRHHPKQIDGVPVVQCTSPGRLMGSAGAAGAVPGMLFFSGFENTEAQADVTLALSSNSLMYDGGNGPAPVHTLGYVEASDGVHLRVEVRNVGRSAAAGVRVREYLRVNGDEPFVTEGDTPASCTAVPAGAMPDPCAGFDPTAFPLAFDIASLPAGHGVDLQLNRHLSIPAAAGSTELEIGYAAFVAPQQGANGSSAADGLLGNNAQWVNFAIS